MKKTIGVLIFLLLIVGFALADPSRKPPDSNIAVVPEPATMLLLGTGAVAIAWKRLRKK